MHCPSAMKLFGIRHPFVMCNALKFLYHRCNTPCTITASYTLQSTEKRASSFSHSRKDPRGSRRLIRCGQQHVRHSIRQWYRSTRSAIMKTYDGCQLHFPIAHAHLERSCRAANIVSCQCIWHSIYRVRIILDPPFSPPHIISGFNCVALASLTCKPCFSLLLSHAWCEVGRRAGPE
jgi:hypothetical protein